MARSLAVASLTAIDLIRLIRGCRETIEGFSIFPPCIGCAGVWYWLLIRVYAALLTDNARCETRLVSCKPQALNCRQESQWVWR